MSYSVLFYAASMEAHVKSHSVIQVLAWDWVGVAESIGYRYWGSQLPCFWQDAGKSQTWCVKRLGWRFFCVCNCSLTVRRASAKVIHVDLQIFLFQRPLYPYFPLIFQLHQRLKVLLCPFPSFLILVDNGWRGVHCYFSALGSEPFQSNNL